MKGQEMGVAEREDEIDSEQEQTEEVTTEEQVEQTETEETTEEGEDSEEAEDVVQIGDEEPPASEEETAAPKWVKDLRQRQRELARENAELKAKLGTGQPAATQKPTLPQKPKMDDPDIDFDVEKYEQARDAWDAKKREVDSWEANQRAAAQAQQERIRKLDEAYAASRSSLKVKDFADAEETVTAALNEWQQGIAKVGPANPGALVYALGKNPKKLQELASIKDPVKFAVAVGKLETEVKVTKRTSTKPAPESTVRSSSSSATSGSATLERLRAEADKTGDRSKVAAYLRQQRNAGK